MVKSKLNETVNYLELKYLSQEDKNYEASLYELLVFDTSIIIAIGLPKFTFINKNIVYYPVYIIKNDKVHSQIGLYEIMSNTQPSILDEDGDVDLSQIGPILLFSYINKEYIVEGTSESVIEKPSEREHKSYSQEKTQSDMERTSYSNHKNEDWVQTYMRNHNYAIIENEGGGDCLFASIRDGLKLIGKTVTVEELRTNLADNATEEVFQGYRNMYTMVQDELKNIDADIKTYEKEFKELTQRGKKTKDRDLLLSLTTQAKDIKDIHTRAKKSKTNTIGISNEYKFMNGIDTLSKFKTKIQTCEFWGDTWAISTLERILNFKLILFSREAYKGNDMDNVILCNQLNDSVLEDAGVFKPSHYILLEYIGDHYRLITYKNIGALIFSEIPYDIKTRIVDKCMERNSGVFSLIPEFIDFMTELHMEPDQEQEFDAITDNLYDPTTVFQFYYSSADAPSPGKGSGEEIQNENKFKFNELGSFPNWRRKLDNFLVEPFELDNHTWNTVEHYYQASKFKENNPQFYITFAKDTNPENELSKNPSMAKAAGSISGKYKGKKIRPSSITIDPHFYAGRDKEVMKRALTRKFTQNEELQKILTLTKDAKLQRFIKGAPPKILESLMIVRKELSINK